MNKVILPRLKQLTSHAHEHLETRLDLFYRVTSPKDYLSILKKFYGFYVPLERLLGETDWRSIGINFENRRKVPLLSEDFTSFGLSTFEIQSIPLCREDDLPSTQTIGNALGCMYVLEGATLGGQIISSHFQEKLGLNRAQGLAFYLSYGTQTGSQWKLFCQSLETFALSQNFDQSLIDDMSSSAIQTFQKLEDWLCKEENQK